MGNEIHARDKGNGSIVYRVWDVVNDFYLTQEEGMDEQTLRDYLIEEEVQAAVESFERTIDGRISRANTRGTSYAIGSGRSIDGPWDEEASDDDDHDAEE